MSKIVMKAIAMQYKAVWKKNRFVVCCATENLGTSSTLFYKQLGPDFNPQSCVYFQGFFGLKVA